MLQVLFLLCTICFEMQSSGASTFIFRAVVCAAPLRPSDLALLSSEAKEKLSSTKGLGLSRGLGSPTILYLVMSIVQALATPEDEGIRCPKGERDVEVEGPPI